MANDELYAIASGWNVPQISLTRLIDISVSGELYAGPKAITFYDDGDIHPKTNRAAFSSGYPNVKWLVGIAYYEQYTYAKTTWCAGGLSGDVTIYTTLGGVSFSRMNATLWLDKPVQMHGKIWYTEMPMTFIGLFPST